MRCLSAIKVIKVWGLLSVPGGYLSRFILDRDGSLTLVEGAGQRMLRQDAARGAGSGHSVRVGGELGRRLMILRVILDQGHRLEVGGQVVMGLEIGAGLRHGGHDGLSHHGHGLAAVEARGRR